MNYFDILISASIINNYVLVKMIGITPFISSSKNLLSSFYMGLSVLIVLTISSLISYPLYKFFEIGLGIKYLDLLFAVLINLIVFKIFSKLIERHFPALYNTIGIYFPIILFNSVLFGAFFELINKKANILEALFYSVGSGFGYMLALILLSFLKLSIDENKLPQCFRGAPFILICTGVISMLFQLMRGVVSLILL